LRATASVPADLKLHREDTVRSAYPALDCGGSCTAASRRA
jgi:hypothetical protein